MRIVRRIGWWFAGGIAVVVLLAPLLLQTDRLRLSAIASLQKTTGKTVEMRSLSVTLFPRAAIRITGLGVKNPPHFPAGYIVQVPHIEAHFDVVALLRGELVVRSVTLHRPSINLVSDPNGPWNFEIPGVRGTPYSALSIGIVPRLRIEHAHLAVSNLLPSGAPGPVFMEAQDLSTELKNFDPKGVADPTSRTLDGEGDVSAALLRFGNIEATELNALVRLQARQLSLTEMRASTYGGTTHGKFVVKLSGKEPSFMSDAQLAQIDMESLLNAFPNARGKMTGKLEGELKVDGELRHTVHPLAGLHGTGHLTVRDGQVPSLMLNANLMRLAHYNDLGPAKQAPASFKFVSTDLELDNERLSSMTIDVDGYGVDVDGSGSVSLSGSDALDYTGVAALTERQGFITNAVARMAGGSLKDGKLSFPFHIKGTIDKPEFGKGS